MKYVLGILALFIVTIFAIIAVTRGRGDEQPTGEPQIVMSEQAREGTSVSVTTQGELVGQDERRAIRITVTQAERRLEILTGYEEAVERAHVYPNTPAAYETFLIALEQLGFSRERETVIEDERAACPTGRRYVYELKEYSQEQLRLWGTSCGRGQGNFGGVATTVRQLFEAQIPEYRDRVKGVNLR